MSDPVPRAFLQSSTVKYWRDGISHCFHGKDWLAPWKAVCTVGQETCLLVQLSFNSSRGLFQALGPWVSHLTASWVQELHRSNQANVIQTWRMMGLGSTHWKICCAPWKEKNRQTEQRETFKISLLVQRTCCNWHNNLKAKVAGEWLRTETPPPLQTMDGFLDPLEKEMATHSSIPAWEIPWTQEPSGL